MKHRIFHKVLVSALAICLIAPFSFGIVKADATNQQILDMLTSIRSQVVNILSTQRIGSSGNYDAIDYLQKLDTNLSLLDSRIAELQADMTSAWDQSDPIQSQNYYESIMNYFKEFYLGIGTENTRLYNIQVNSSNILSVMQDMSTDLDNINNKVNQLVTLVSNIDNSIDTISWKSLTVSITYSDNFAGTYSNTLPSNNLSTVYARVELPTSDQVSYLSDNITKISFGLRSSYSSTPYHYVYLDEIYNYDGRPISNILVYYDKDSLGNTVYLNKMVYGNATLERYIYFKFSTSNGYFRINDQTSYSWIGDNDIEYWQLLEYFNQYNNWNLQLSKSDTIISKLDTIQNGTTSTQTIVNSNNQKNSQLSDSIDQYDSLENQFKTDFNTHMNDIQKPSLDNIVSAAAWYTTQLTALFNASGSFQIIYVLPLVLGIALFFIGRGGIVFRQSSNTESEYIHTRYNDDGTTTVEHGTYVSSGSRRSGRRF